MLKGENHILWGGVIHVDTVAVDFESAFRIQKKMSIYCMSVFS